MLSAVEAETTEAKPAAVSNFQGVVTESAFIYVSFGCMTKFEIQSPQLVSVRTYRIEKIITVKIIDMKTIIKIPFIFLLLL